MAQALQNVTVNGKPATEYLSAEKSREIQQFLAEELRSMGRSTRHHISARNGERNTTRTQSAGNGSLRYA